MRLVTFIGNRPQFVKAAAVSRVLREHHEELLVHTGQHYDDELSTIFVTELGIPRPEHELSLARPSLRALGLLQAGPAGGSFWSCLVLSRAPPERETKRDSVKTAGARRRRTQT